MRVYIAGPINGYPDLNRKAFKLAADRLLSQGHEPVNPHDIDPECNGTCKGEPTQNNNHGYGCYMIPDLKALLNCEGFTLLPGWEASKGAMIEYKVANICGLKYVE